MAFWAPDDGGTVSVWVRELASGVARPIPGSQVPPGDHQRIDFGADSRTLFFVGGGRLFRTASDTGSAEAMHDALLGLGVTQSSGGVVLFASTWGGPLRMIPAGGQTSQPVAISGGDGVDLWPAYPRFLHDGRHFLVLSTRRRQIFVGNLEGGTAQFLIDAASPAEFAHGHLLYARNGVLMAQAFDPQSRATRGVARQVVSGIGINPASIFEASLSSSTTGRLVYWEGFAAPRSTPCTAW